MSLSVSATVQPVPTPAGSGRLVRNILMLLGSQLTTWAFTLLFTLVVPRILHPEGMGQLVTAWSISGILNAIVALGINVLLVKEVARDRPHAPQLVGTAILLRVAVFLPALLALAAYLRVAHYDSQQVLVLWLATAGMLINMVAATLQAGFAGMERMEYQAYDKMLSYLMAVPLSIVLVWRGFGVVGIMALQLAVAVVCLGLNGWWSRPLFSVDWRIDVRRIRWMVAASLPYWLGAVFYTVYVWIDSLMLSLMTGPKEVGWYGAPTQLFTALLVVPVILSTAWFPRLAAAFKESPDRFRANARISLDLVLGLSLPISVGAALVADPLIRVLFGPRFTGSIPVLVILSLALPVTSLNVIGNQIVVAANRQVAWTKLMVAAAVTNPLLNFFLIRYFQDQHHNGAIGAGLSLLVTEILQGAVALLLMRGLLDGASLRRLMRAALATAGMAVAVLLVHLLGLLAQVSVGIVTFTLLAWRLSVLSPEELAELGSLVDKLRAKLNLPRLKGAAA